MRATGLRIAGIGIVMATSALTAVVVSRRSAGEPASEPAVAPAESPRRASAAAPPPDSAQGLRCIRGGTSREEVRRVMGEPDSIAFGDWLYGRSSVTFGYGVVLDYANVDGNLPVCP